MIFPVPDVSVHSRENFFPCTFIIYHFLFNWEIDGETVETVSDFILGGAPKSLQMVIAAMKLKDAYSLEEKLWPT